MSLDLFTRNIDDAVNYAARVSAPELPSTFADNFGDAWNRGFLTSQSISGTNRQLEARRQLVDDAIAQTGDQSLASFISPDGSDSDYAGFNRKLAEHKASRPNINASDLSDEKIQQRADDIGVAQLQTSRNFAQRERTTGGAVGEFVGSAAASFTDPVNLAAFPLAAPESLGVLGTALAWSAIGGGSQAAIEILNARSMERIQPGYTTSSEPVGNVLEAAGFAGALGGTVKGLSSLWSRYKTGSWPRTVRDAGNVVESEAQIANTNPMPGVEGETAHRTALQKAIDDLANGRPVNVDGIIAPEQVQFIEAWHGSPHNFDRFDINRIGTGEGAQAYGHGLYFAESPEVAGIYKERLAIKRGGTAAHGEAEIRHEGGMWNVYIDGQLDNAFAAKSDAEKFVNKGTLYQVRLTADKSRFLDWDKPLAEQPEVLEAIKARLPKAGAISKFIDEIASGGMQDIRRGIATDPARTGERAYSAISRLLGGDEKASEFLNQAGIPGIKYLDQGSRGGMNSAARELAEWDAAVAKARADLKAAEDGGVASNRDLAQLQAEVTRAENGRSIVEARVNGSTSNYVVFDDKHVEITHKNGKPVKPEIRQAELDKAAGLPPRQPELALQESAPSVAELNTPTVNALNEELTPAKAEELRSDPDLAETVARDLDKLMLEKPDLEVPTGVTVDADGRTIPAMRKVESIVAEADDRLAAAKEIEACVGPYPQEAA